MIIPNILEVIAAYPLQDAEIYADALFIQSRHVFQGLSFCLTASIKTVGESPPFFYTDHPWRGLRDAMTQY